MCQQKKFEDFSQYYEETHNYRIPMLFKYYSNIHPMLFLTKKCKNCFHLTHAERMVTRVF